MKSMDEQLVLQSLRLLEAKEEQLKIIGKTVENSLQTEMKSYSATLMSNGPIITPQAAKKIAVTMANEEERAMGMSRDAFSCEGGERGRPEEGSWTCVQRPGGEASH
tara:strand:+ start:467 stop:787 length:321 start_codon:yes stop_codon:yes gene_type:complete